MKSRSKGWDLAAAIVAALVMVICIVGLLRDARLSGTDIISWRHTWKRAYIERWQEELLYAAVTVIAGVMFAVHINKLREP
jgi:hypothetical protein